MAAINEFWQEKGLLIEIIHNNKLTCLSMVEKYRYMLILAN